jgi:hypothetical protein
MNRSAVLFFTLFLFALFLAGCSHSVDCSMGYWHDDCAPGTRAYEQKQQDDAKANAANDASDDAKCKAYNFTPNTPAYQKCRDQIQDQRETAETSDRAAYVGRLLGRPPGN